MTAEFQLEIALAEKYAQLCYESVQKVWDRAEDPVLVERLNACWNMSRDLKNYMGFIRSRVEKEESCQSAKL